MSDQFSICVFCGSRPGARPTYTEAARAVGEAIASEGWRLVYGAGDVGLMGTVANAATERGGRTLGVIPVHLLAREAPEGAFGDRIVTETMHERKKVMFMNADSIVVLPGGAGSLDEFFEVLTWAQIGLHSKPIFLLNTDGYWTPLMSLVDHVVSEEFATPSLCDHYRAVTSTEELVTALREACANLRIDPA